MTAAPEHPCSECGNRAPRVKRLPDGGGLCRRCYNISRRVECSGCRRVRAPSARTKGGEPLCGHCARPKRACGRYFTDHQAGGEPRWTTLDQHDRGWNGTRNLLEQITPDAPLNRVKIVTRSGELYDAPLEDYDREAALEALSQGRTVAATNRGAAAWLAELRAVTQYAQASNQITPATAPLLTEMHRIALSEVVPSMQLPANSEAAPRLVQRLNDTMAMIEKTAAPKRVDDYQAPGTSIQPTGPSLS